MTTWRRRVSTTLAVLCACLGGALSAQGAAMHEVAVKAVRPAGAPEYGDVCFRYGWIRKDTFPTVEDAKKAIRAFHATRVDWFYPGSHTADPGATYVTKESKAFIDWCHARGMKIGGAMSTLTTHKAWDAGSGTNSGRFRGKPDIPDYAAAAIAWGKAQVDAGVDTLVCDDFFGYRSGVMKQQFSDNVIKLIKAHKEDFTIAGNDGSTWSTSYVKQYAFDFHYSDSNFLKFKPTPGRWWAASKDHRKEGSTFLIHPNRPMTKEMCRKAISLGYASGVHVIAPWDEWLSGAPRLFADPADFADLYGFARALGQAGYLNDYEDAAVGGYELKETRYGATPPISVSGGSGKLSVFARARPSEAESPIVLHLVESGKPQAATLQLPVSALFGSTKVNCRLLSPLPYDKAAHNKAETAGDYGALARTVKLEHKVEGDMLVIEIPPMTPWGVIILEKGQ